MGRPQQPEIARSGRGATDPSSAKSHVDAPEEESGRTGPVPLENQPGHHPPREQDKPDVPRG